MDTSTFRTALFAAACLLASTSLVACKRASGDTSHVGDDVKGVGKATEKAAKDIGSAASDFGDKARHNLEDATNKAGADAQDGWITAKVKTELTSAGLDPLHLHVDTDGKVVTLSGTVDSAADARKAVAAAKTVTGVRAVQDHIFVKTGQR
jgi:hyperosmotically inducible periplasmic protein